MTAFGGRAALVGVLLILIAVAAIRLARLVSGNARIDLKAAAAAAIFVPAVIGALILAVELGAFDRLFDRFVNDDGSARTRIIMLQLLASIPLEQLMIGPDQGVIETLKRIEGLDLGIESFWVAFILSYGIMVSVIFFIALGLFMIDVIREAGRAAFVPVLFFFAVASTSVSLSAKSPLLGMFVALLLIIPERRNSVRPEAAGDVSR